MLLFISLKRKSDTTELVEKGDNALEWVAYFLIDKLLLFLLLFEDFTIQKEAWYTKTFEKRMQIGAGFLPAWAYIWNTVLQPIVQFSKITGF